MVRQKNESGFILVLVLVVLAILTTFGVAMMMLAAMDIASTGNIRSDQDALNIAYSRYQRAQKYIIDGGCTFNNPDAAVTHPNILDSDGDLYLDPGDDLATMEVVCEDMDENSSIYLKKNFGRGKLTIRAYLKDCNNTAVVRDHFLIKATGELNGVKKTIEARIEHKSFLEFSRFSENEISYGNIAVFVTGDIYIGTSITQSGSVHWEKNVYVKGSISPSTSDNCDVWTSTCRVKGTLFYPYEKEVSLGIGNQMDDFFDQADISAGGCGWVIKNGQGRNCLCDSQDGGTDNLLVLEFFKNLDGVGYDSADSTTWPRYDTGDGVTVANNYNPSTNANYNCPINCKWPLPTDANGPTFNGVVYWDNSNTDDIHVQGTLGLENKGKSISIFVRDDNTIIIDNNIKTAPDSNLQPVNLGLVSGYGEGESGSKDIRWSHLVPNYVEVHAAVMTTGDTWRVNGDNNEAAVNTANGMNPPNNSNILTALLEYDLDQNDILESGSASCDDCSAPDVDCTRDNGMGWDECDYDPTYTNYFNTYGPLITVGTGKPARFWAYNCGRSSCSGHGSIHLHQAYDSDIIQFPPPFPKISNLIHLVSYTEYDF